MTAELIISIIALVTALFAAIRTYFYGERNKNRPETEIQPKAKKEKETEDIIMKTLQSIEDYRKHP